MTLLKSLLINSFLICSPLALSAEIPQQALEVFPALDQIYHPVSTSHPEAQKSFDMGLTYVFAYNHDLGFREFERASKIDPNLAMAYWGMALALGQNVNSDVTPENEVRAYNYVQQALKLSANASASEQDYISAIATRYSNDDKPDLIALRGAYRNAMKKLVQKYPQDLDASTLYAESLLQINPWKWWTWDGKPTEGVYEAIDVLESVLKRNPDHIGANHFNIHAWEESPYPERALMSAHRLETLLPEAGHLLHMPVHIFLQTGDYVSAIKTSLKAVAQDQAYIQKYGVLSGPYPLHYFSHNLYIQTRIFMLMEDYENAIRTAFQLVDFVEPHIERMPHVESFTKAPLEIFLYFHRWNDILHYTPNSKNPLTQMYWRYSRAIAYAALGNIDAAEREQELMVQESKRIPESTEVANNPVSELIKLLNLTLHAALDKAQDKPDGYISHLNQAADLQERLNYDEPPLWYIPIRQTLGFALLRQGRYADAEAAFQKVLNDLRRNGRTLFGLYLSLKAQDRDIGAYWVKREMVDALKHSTAPLNTDRL